MLIFQSKRFFSTLGFFSTILVGVIILGLSGCASKKSSENAYSYNWKDNSAAYKRSPTAANLPEVLGKSLEKFQANFGLGPEYEAEGKIDEVDGSSKVCEVLGVCNKGGSETARLRAFLDFLAEEVSASGKDGLQFQTLKFEAKIREGLTFSEVSKMI